MRENFEDYFSAVKELRTESNYDYTDEELEKHSDYFKDCWKNNRSCYKALEFLWFEINGGL